MKTIAQYLSAIQEGDYLSLARVLTLIENSLPGSSEILKELVINQQTPVIGITGPPGAGKSTLVNAMIDKLSGQGKKIAVLAVDPTSPFNLGSLLGDRVRMSAHFNNPNVFIRSVATRGSVGGLSAKIIEMTDVLKASGFDYIIVETVGVGQSEIEIAGLADITMVILVPEAGDEIQHIKSGLMEIGDAFVVNKADREGADSFANQLKKMLHQRVHAVPVFKTVADKQTGVDELLAWLTSVEIQKNEKKLFLYTEKAYKLIQNDRMFDVLKAELQQEIAEVLEQKDFNLYRFVAAYAK
ncbi:methylmalonyl Co-A mutase-associated GTPase MeaB [Pedobacter cryoconitis]|uniref:methylmalonyl Co-A mutase-associated GTPase MeaB n=1 Tax=Pedobacter cryoconitis TaxID=188932 RepID=UPI001616A180|nr:methylmalonyl Co-A mutase-associated GTPase MeaB [Pedobacter cryoconitis]MBB5648371.1 LAO/AO transport system kinase [Pedobacter cryoconitis]